MTTMLLRIPVEIELRHRGRVIRVRGLADTGAPDFLLISEEAAAPLGLRLDNPHESGGAVAGAKILVWDSVVDKLEIVGNPDCAMDNVRIQVARGYSRTPGEEEFLLGDDFFRTLNAVIEYSEGGVSIRCRRAKANLTPILLGGGILAAAVAVATLTWDSL
jgi:predicted aspartyl protease